MKELSAQTANELAEIMFTAEQVSGKDYMGFMWFEIFKNGKTTDNSYNAIDEEHAIRMHKQFK